MTAPERADRPSFAGKHPTQPASEDGWGVRLPHEGKRPTEPPRGGRWDICRPSAWPDRRIREIAAAQQGQITRSQLFAVGLTRAMVDNAVARGRLIAVHRGVYAIAYLPLTRLAPYLAAVLAVGHGALLSHHSAAAVWGLRPHPEGDVDVSVVGRDAGRGRDGIAVHRMAALDPGEASKRQGIPIVTGARALLDIGPDLTDRQLERAFDRALTERIATRSAVADVAARSPRRPGAPRLAALAAAELAPDTNSPGEEALLALIRAAGLPIPQLNVWLGPHEIDMLWPDHQLAVEVDGFGFHSTRRRFEHDRARDLELESSGLVIVRFTRDQVVHRPEMVLVTLARRLTEREAERRLTEREAERRLTEREAQLGRSSRSVA